MAAFQSQRFLNQLDRRLGLGDFHDQLVISLVAQINDDGLFRMMHIPKDSLAVLIEGSSRDDSGHVGSGHPDTVPPTSCDLRICSDTRDVDERNFEAAIERPEPVRAPDVQYQLVFRYR